MDGDGNAKDDVKVPDSDVGKEIETAFEGGKDLMVTIIAAMGASLSFSPLPSHHESRLWIRDYADMPSGEEQAISWKEAPAEK